MSITITVDGQARQVLPGATVASAWAQGAAGTTRRSVGGQLRAPLCGMGVCHECRVEVDGSRRLACQTIVREGMQVRTGSERAAGVSSSEALAPPLVRPGDLLIVGAGPAGLAAALAAAPSGVAITLLDDNPAPGGQIWRQGAGAPAGSALQQQLDRLGRHANVRLLSGARVAAMAGSNALLIDDGAGGFVQRWRRIILCTGARELLLPFPGWTLPGVTGAGALQALVKNGLDVAGQRVVIAGSGPLLLAAAASLLAAGARVLRVAEQAALPTVLAFAARLPRWPSKCRQALRLAEPRWRSSRWVVQVEGDQRVQRVQLGGRRPEAFECERLACGFGLVPNAELAQLLGCTIDDQGAIVTSLDQSTTVDACFAAGECTGIGGSERAALQGAIAGHAAVGERTALPALQRRLAPWQAFADHTRRAFVPRPELQRLARADTLICRCEDVPLAALQRAGGWIDAKLHTRCGMGACQGRVCGAAARALFGWTIAPPRHLLNPVPIGLLAGIDAVP